MATMLPRQIDETTVSAAERRVFGLLRADPGTSDWVILHSLGLSRRGSKPYGEIDFVLLVPGGGIFCLEVKGGRVACRDGVWETTDRYGRTSTMKRSPFLQAREGMFALRSAVYSRKCADLPDDLVFGYAVVMPDISFGERCPEWENWQVMDRDALRDSVSIPLRRLVHEQRRLHGCVDEQEPSFATIRVIQRLIRPDFELVVTRSALIEHSEAELLRLTDEQFLALDLMADNERCLFQGAAGTGKTMLALEYARRAAFSGINALLICYNRMLGDWLRVQIARVDCGFHVTAGSYFGLLRDTIVRSSVGPEFLQEEAGGQSRELYERTYPLYGVLAVQEAQERYDIIIMDEAQDLLREGVLDVLDAWLDRGFRFGRWAIFGDFVRQAIFAQKTGEELKLLVRERTEHFAVGRLTLNCRNTTNIGEETALLSGFQAPPYRMGQVDGLPVEYHYFRSAETQQSLLVNILQRLAADRVSNRDVIILSHRRLSRSGLAALVGHHPFSLVEVEGPGTELYGQHVIRFATIQSFKGMESPVVILADVEKVSDAEPQALLYVAMSRARSHLIVLVHECARPAIADCVRRKLEEAWKR